MLIDLSVSDDEEIPQRVHFPHKKRQHSSSSSSSQNVIRLDLSDDEDLDFNGNQSRKKKAADTAGEHNSSSSSSSSALSDGVGCSTINSEGKSIAREGLVFGADSEINSEEKAIAREGLVFDTKEAPVPVPFPAQRHANAPPPPPSSSSFSSSSSNAVDSSSSAVGQDYGASSSSSSSNRRSGSSAGAGAIDISDDDATNTLLQQIQEQDEQERNEELEKEKLSMAYIDKENSHSSSSSAGAFQEDTTRYSCVLCMDDDLKLGELAFLDCVPRGHHFCMDCLQGWLSSKIGDAEVDEMMCPGMSPDGGKCTYKLSIHEIKQIVSCEDFEKYERFSLRKFGEQDENCRFCPKCNVWMAEIPQREPEDAPVFASVECGRVDCKHKFCGRCGEAPHRLTEDGDVTCEAFAKWRAENEKGDEEFENWKAEEMKKGKLVFCPGCQNGAELQTGVCKFAYCKCSQRFCFLCSVKLEEKNHYAHYQGVDPRSGKKCTGPFGELCMGPGDPGLSANGDKSVANPKVLPGAPGARVARAAPAKKAKAKAIKRAPPRKKK